MQPARAHALALLLSLAGAPAALAADAGHSLEFHGYIRTGLGASQDGTTQAEFQAPGAPARYRLGNEAQTNFEFAADYLYGPGGTAQSDAQLIQAYFMMDDVKPFSDSGELGLNHTAQAYLRFADYLGPGTGLWVGRRYYDRKSIYINRYYWLNAGQNAQAGAGLEGLRLGPGVLDTALMRTEDPGVTAGSATGTINGTWLDLRYRLGDTTLWSTLAQRAPQAAIGLPARHGYGFGVWHDINAFHGGSNTTALLYRRGAAIVQGTANPNPVREDQGYDLDRAYTAEINNSLRIAPATTAYALEWAVIARHTDVGKSGIDGSTQRWYSTGVRPVWFLGPHLSLAAEAGIDYVDDRVNDRAGDVRKFTVAVQLSRSRAFVSYPLVRLFVTRAEWSDQFKGLVGASPGDAPYANDTSGWTVGTQVETVW